MKLIGENFDKIPKSSDVVGLMENDPEYQLIVEANNIAAEVDAEISRFPCILFFINLTAILWC